MSTEITEKVGGVAERGAPAGYADLVREYNELVAECNRIRISLRQAYADMAEVHDALRGMLNGGGGVRDAG